MLGRDHAAAYTVRGAHAQLQQPPHGAPLVRNDYTHASPTASVSAPACTQVRAEVLTSVELDGTASAAGSAPITAYSWVVTSVPEGLTQRAAGVTTSTSLYTGTYVANLTVRAETALHARPTLSPHAVALQPAYGFSAQWQCVSPQLVGARF
jgi:hypothetical protein